MVVKQGEYKLGICIRDIHTGDYIMQNKLEDQNKMVPYVSYENKKIF